MNNKNKSVALYIICIIAVITSSCTTTNRLTTHTNNNKDTGTLIVIAFPQEVVRSTEAFYSKLLPLIGMGIQGYIRAGHASMVIIEDGSDIFEYFDLGRYISPEGYARVRGANTDPELAIDIKAKWNNGKIDNLDHLFRWLYDHPEKTRGYGDLYASISENVNYERVKEYIKTMQDQNIIRYGPFDRKGSNCARFVSDAMLNGILDRGIQKKIKALYYITPSVLGNVNAANSHEYYYITNEDSVYTSTKKLGPIQRKMIADRGKGKGYELFDDSYVGTIKQPTHININSNWQWLGGRGYGAWYAIEKADCSNQYEVSQYCVDGELMFKALYETEKEINLNEAYLIDYPSHYMQITLKIENEKVVLLRVK